MRFDAVPLLELGWASEEVVVAVGASGAAVVGAAPFSCDFETAAFAFFGFFFFFYTVHVRVQYKIVRKS